MWATHCQNCGKKLVDNSFGFCSLRCANEWKLHKDSACTPTLHGCISSDEWVNGVYEHITDHPIKITGGKKELKAVCEKYGVMAKALLKHKSSGKGYEMKV